MPKITIKERDLTSPGLNQSTSNAVFIPGYAIMGPINTPVLCNTLDDFRTTFGNVPYTFRKRESLTPEPAVTDYYFEEGSYERSYVYATETLKRGLPVIYTRMFDSKNIDTWKAQATVVNINAGSSKNTILKAKENYIGKIGNEIYYTIQAPKFEDSKLTQPTLLTLGINSTEKTVKNIEEKHYIVFNLDDQGKFEVPTTYYLDLDSALVDITWPTGTISEASITSTPTVPGGEALAPQPLKVSADEDEFTPNAVYSNLGSILNLIEDKGEYSFKFITSGAYPTFNNIENGLPENYSGLDVTMAETAQERGDCIAVIDAIPSTSQTSTELLEKLQSKSYGEAGPYATMFTPAGLYNCPTVNKQLVMPASFGYITAYATSVQNNPGWLAVAGASRGVVTNLVSTLGPKITSAQIDELQARDNKSINPITLVKPYGNLIWGNRTLKNNAILNNLTAQSFLNIRCLLCDLKKVIYTTAKGLTFEQNNDILWINFKAGIIPTLEQMVTGGGLSGYEIKRVRTTEKAKVKALIRLYAVEAVEDFDIDIELTDSEITTVE